MKWNTIKCVNNSNNKISTIKTSKLFVILFILIILLIPLKSKSAQVNTIFLGQTFLGDVPLPPPPPSCSHGLCEEGIALDINCNPIVTTLCATDSYCCDSIYGTWDSTCIHEVWSIAGSDQCLTRYTLTVNKVNYEIPIGTGTVVSSPSGINCGTSCTTQSHDYAIGSYIILTPTADLGSLFAQWSGSGVAYGTNQRRVYFDPMGTSDQTVNAEFIPNNTHLPFSPTNYPFFVLYHAYDVSNNEIGLQNADTNTLDSIPPLLTSESEFTQANKITDEVTTIISDNTVTTSSNYLPFYDVINGPPFNTIDHYCNRVLTSTRTIVTNYTMNSYQFDKTVNYMHKAYVSEYWRNRCNIGDNCPCPVTNYSPTCGSGNPCYVGAFNLYFEDTNNYYEFFNTNFSSTIDFSNFIYFYKKTNFFDKYPTSGWLNYYKQSFIPGAPDDPLWSEISIGMIDTTTTSTYKSDYFGDTKIAEIGSNEGGVCPNGPMQGCGSTCSCVSKPGTEFPNNCHCQNNYTGTVIDPKKVTLYTDTPGVYGIYSYYIFTPNTTTGLPNGNAPSQATYTYINAGGLDVVLDYTTGFINYSGTTGWIHPINIGYGGPPPTPLYGNGQIELNNLTP